MNNSFFVFSISLFLCSSISAQFYTVSKKKDIINVEVIQKRNDRENYLSNKPKATNDILKEPKAPKEYKAIINPTTKPDSINTKLLLSLPLNKISVTSNYGVRKDPITGKQKKHNGIDLAAQSDNVKAIMPGKITKIGYEKKGLGNYVKIKHGEFESIYGHLHTSIGTEGDLVNAGTIVGLSGSTGRSTGEHLHLAIKFKSKYIDPKPILEYITDIKKTKSGKE